MNKSLTGILFTLIIFQLLFLSLFLFTQTKGKRVSNILLGSFFMSICLNLLDVFLLDSGVYYSSPEMAGWGSCLPLVFGPLIFFYTQSVIYKEFAITSKCWFHFFLFLIFFAGTEFFYLIQPAIVQQRILSDLQKHEFPKWLSAASLCIFFQFLLYVLASLRLVSRYKKASGQFFSDQKNMDISWLYSTLIFLIAIILISAFNGLFTRTAWAKYYLLVFNFIILAMLIYVIRIILHILRKPDFLPFFREEELDNDVSLSRKRNSFDQENDETEKVAQEVIRYMQVNKPYLEPELTLYQLAAQLSIKPRLLSQAINKQLGQNFYDFINRYRIGEASRLLTNPKDNKITILEVLYDVGFNSKSSFNTLFKKYTGLTPSEFKKKNLH
jgi:AraC-like DNA-binding protein